MEQLLQAERLLVVGLLDQAEALYRHVAEEDPRNALALTGLSRVALERGDDMAAHELAARALTIDPENVAAIRLESRMREVLAARGVSVAPLTGGAPPGAVPPAGAEPAKATPLLRRILGRR
jgi:tetratricopeptide (TPR) repeat protein